MKKKRILNNQKGAIAVVFALLIVVLIGFIALSIDAGRWYAAREKAQEACDAAVLSGIQAFGSANWQSLAEDVAKENFPQGYLGFLRSTDDINIVGKSISGAPRVEGTVCAGADTFFGGLIGIDTVNVCASCAAGREPLEIMLIIDRSDSMKGAPLTDIRAAAQSFVDNFAETQGVDKMGLVSFATGVKVPFDLQNDFVAGIKTEIGSIVPGDSGTNMEDALDQADDDVDRDSPPTATTTFTEYAWNVPQSKRAKQFLILFTDGRPTSFKAKFRRYMNGVKFDDYAVIPNPKGASWDEPQEVDVCGDRVAEVYNVGMLHHPYTGKTSDLPIEVYFLPTGDGKPIGETQCKWDCGGNYVPYENTKWPVFNPVWNDEYGEDEDDYSIDYYCVPSSCDSGGVPACCKPPYCNIPKGTLKGYVLDTAEKMTIYHARKLKEQGIIIYCIGVDGTGIVAAEPREFLKKITTTEDHYYEVPTDGDLTKILNDITSAIKGQIHLL